MVLVVNLEVVNSVRIFIFYKMSYGYHNIKVIKVSYNKCTNSFTAYSISFSNYVLKKIINKMF